jgi:hypothetical protein
MDGGEVKETNWFEGAVPIFEYDTMPTDGGVYAIVHKNLQFVYVGTAKSIRGRIKQHVRNSELGQGSPGLDNAWRTYGPDSLRVAVLEHGVPTVLLRAREDHWLRILGQDYALLNSQSHSNYVSNFTHEAINGITYLIYGDVQAGTRPLADINWENGKGVGDIYELLDDGITSGGSRTENTFMIAAIGTRYMRMVREFSVGATLSSGGIFTAYDSPDAMLGAFLTYRNKGSELVFQNLDDDLEYLLPALEKLPSIGFEIGITVDGRGHAVYAKVSRKKQVWYLRDIYAILPLSEDDRSILLGTTNAVNAAEYMQFVGEGVEQHVGLQRHVESVFSTYKAYKNTLRDCYGISPGLSAGSTALKAFRHSVTSQQQRPEVEKYARRAYFGGLLFLIWVHSHRDLFQLDIDAACAAAMHRHLDAEGSGCFSTRELADCPGVYLCEVSGPKDLPLPFVPARVDHDTIWHTGEVRTYLCSNTIALARALGYSITVVKGYIF